MRLHPIKVRKIADLRRKGMAYREIAKEVGVSTTTVQRYAQPVDAGMLSESAVSVSGVPAEVLTVLAAILRQMACARCGETIYFFVSTIAVRCGKCRKSVSLPCE